MEVKKIPTPPKRPIPQKPNIQKSIPQKPQIRKPVEVETEKPAEQKNMPKVVEEPKQKEPMVVDKKVDDKIEKAKSENQSTQQVPKTNGTIEKKVELVAKSKEKTEQSKEITFGLLGGIALVMSIVFFFLMFVL